jgi:hypothetical protein
MKTKKSGKSRLPISSIILYITAVITFLIAAAALINNIILFKDNIDHYVQQGYPLAEVLKGLLPSQLLPGIFEPVAVYMGIALVLFAAGLINQKITKLINLQINSEIPENSEPEDKEVIETSEVINEDAEF